MEIILYFVSFKSCFLICGELQVIFFVNLKLIIIFDEENKNFAKNCITQKPYARLETRCIINCMNGLVINITI